MIFSEKNNYLFIQYPHSASTAIGKELVECYDGKPILFKHAKYHHFIKSRQNKKKGIYVFSTIRNPLDEVISVYHKFHNDHEGYSDPTNWQKNGGWLSERGLKQFKAVHYDRVTFMEFLDIFYKLPYVNWSVLDHKKFDYIIRYESLQKDFSKLLEQLGLVQVRPLPVVNKTVKSNMDSILQDKELRKRITWVFGPLMQYWGYKFPEGWGEISTNPSSSIAFVLNSAIRRAYWKYIAP